MRWTVTSPYRQGETKVAYLLAEHLSSEKRSPDVYYLPVNPDTTGTGGHPWASG